MDGNCEKLQGEFSPRGFRKESNLRISPNMQDSGIGQAFFPPDFNSEALASTPLSPRTHMEHGEATTNPLSPGVRGVDHGHTGTAPIAVRPCNGKSHRWKYFFLFWIGVAVLTVFGKFCVNKINHWKEMFLTTYTAFSSDNWVNIGICSVFLLSLYLMVAMKKPESLPNVHTPLPHNGASLAKLGQTSLQSGRLNSTGRDFPCRRTFSGHGSDVWHDFRRYFENLAQLNCWSEDHKRRTLLCCLRGQAEAYVYGLPLNMQNDWYSLMEKLERRFGIANMKDTYVADAKLRRKRRGESFREYGQDLEDLFRKAYPDNPDFVKEQALTTFLDNCHDSSDFRLSLRRTKPKTLQEAITNAMEEECVRLTERENSSKPKRAFGTRREVKGRGRGENRDSSRMESSTKSSSHLN